MAKKDQPKTEGILDTVKNVVNIPALLTLIEDVYAVLKKDIPDVLNPQPAMQAKAGCCDHGKCCDQEICLTLCLLKAQLKHKQQCEDECPAE